jgi:hypothetical protein
MPLSAPLKDGATEERGEGTDLRELTGLDTDRESSNVGVPSLELDSVRHGRQAKDSGTRREEMTSVVVGVETDEVAMKDTEEDLSSDGKDSVDFG